MAKVGEKRTVEGLATGPGRYRVTEEEIKERNYYTWRVDPGVDLNRDSVWEMNMIVRQDQLVRFPQDCLYIKFTATQTNKDYESASAVEVEGKNKRVKDLFTQPQTNNPAVYFDGCVGAGAFFQSCEVLVNGVPVPDTQGMGSFQFIYSALNKIYCSQKHREEKYPTKIYRISNDKDGHIPAEGDMKDVHPPDMDSCMELLQFNSRVAAQPKLGRFTMDGVWPFDFQCNLLMALTKEEKYNGFLYPNMRLTLRFKKRDNVNSMLERPNVLPAVYYDSSSKVVLPDPNYEHVKFKITDFTVEYEAVTLKSQEKMDRGKRGGKWYYDAPKILPQSVEHGKMLTVNLIGVTQGAKVVVINWMPRDALFYNESQGKFLSPRFQFIPNAVTVKIVIQGAQGSFMFPDGFKDIGTKDAHNSNTLHVYHDYLVRQKLYSKDFETFVPQGEVKGRDQSFIISFTNERVKDPTQITVTAEYNEHMSPKDWYLVATIVEQHELTYYDKQEIKSQVVI